MAPSPQQAGVPFSSRKHRNGAGESTRIGSGSVAVDERVHAYILVRAGKGAMAHIARAAGGIVGVSRAECVMHGQYDLVLDVPSAGFQDLNHILNEVQGLAGVEHAETCISAVHRRPNEHVDLRSEQGRR